MRQPSSCVEYRTLQVCRWLLGSRYRPDFCVGFRSHSSDCFRSYRQNGHRKDRFATSQKRLTTDFTHLLGCKLSMRIFAASGRTFIQRSAISCSDGSGVDAVRLLTGTPNAMKKSSSPGGEQTQSMRATLPDLFRKNAARSTEPCRTFCPEAFND